MALKLPTPPTPPTPPTIDKGEAVESTPKIDAHKFFEVPFKREEKIPTPVVEEKPVAQEEISAPVIEKKVPTPEELAREAVSTGAGALTKTEVTRPEPIQIPANSNFAENPRDGKAILREFQNEDFQAEVATPRNFNIDRQESHGGIFWIVTLVAAAVFSLVFVKKFMLRKKPALKKSDLFEDSSKRLGKISQPAKNDDDKGKHFEVRI